MPYSGRLRSSDQSGQELLPRMTEVSHERPFEGIVLEHCVRVCHLVWDDLKNIPMFHNFAIVIEAKNVYPGLVVAPWPLLMAVEYNEIAFRNCSLEVDLFAWVFRVHTLEILDERLFTVSHFGVVLDVHIADVFFNGFTRLTLIEHQIIECPRVPFVFLQTIAHFRCVRLPSSNSIDSDQWRLGIESGHLIIL